MKYEKLNKAQEKYIETTADLINELNGAILDLKMSKDEGDDQMNKLDIEFNKMMEKEGMTGMLRVCFKEIKELRAEIRNLKIKPIY